MSQKTKQLYRLVPNALMDVVAHHDPLLKKFIAQTRKTPALFAVTWPDGSPCVFMELYLHSRSLEVTVNSTDGGTLGTEISQLSHIIRYCWKIRKDFCELEHQDFRDFVKYLMDERHPNNPVNPKRNNNTVIEIVDLTIRFLRWLQDNVLLDVVIVGPKNANPRIWLKEVKYTNWRGKNAVALKFPDCPPKATREPKAPMGREMKRQLWDAVSKMSDPATQNRKYVGRFANSQDMLDELTYLKKRRETLLELLEATGARPAELSLMLATENEDCSTTNYITLTTLKRRKLEKRTIPLDRAAAIRLELFIARHRMLLLNRLGTKADPQDRVFLTTDGRVLEPETMEREFSRIAVRAGVGNVQACMSMFRHRFITNMVVIHLTAFLSEAENQGKVRSTMTQADYRTILKRVATFTGHGSELSLEAYIDLAWEEIGVFDYVDPAISLMNVVEGAINTFTALMGDLRITQRRMTSQQVVELAIDELKALKANVESAIRKSHNVPAIARLLFPDGLPRRE